MPIPKVPEKLSLDETDEDVTKHEPDVQNDTVKVDEPFRSGKPHLISQLDGLGQGLVCVKV